MISETTMPVSENAAEAVSAEMRPHTEESISYHASAGREAIGFEEFDGLHAWHARG